MLPFIKKVVSLILCCLLLCGCRMQSAEPAASAPPVRSSVDVLWLDELESIPISYTEYIADSYSEQARVILIPTGEVTGLTLLKLEFQDITEDGTVIYHTEELFSPDVFSGDRPLILGITFFGAIPNYGIAYQDNYGETHRFALQISGENGAMLLLPF